MPCLPIGHPNWEFREGFEHRYTTKEALMAVLSTLPDRSVLVVSRVGNLRVHTGVNPEEDSPYGKWLGIIEFSDDQLELHPVSQGEDESTEG